MRATMYQCADCGMRWMEMGPPRHLRELRAVAAEHVASLRAYCLYGAIVWGLAATLHFLIVVRAPLDTLIEMPAVAWAHLAILVAGGGVALGMCLQQALDISGRWWPERRGLHVAIPLGVAACVGILHGLMLPAVGSSASAPATLDVRAVSLSVVVGAVIAMAATPVVIVRSSAALRRQGFRRSERQPEDPRWQD